MKKLIGLLAFAILLTGCANSRIIYKPALINMNEFSEIIVYRNDLFLGSALLTHLSIDGIPTTEFFGGEYVSIQINPGEHIITTTNPVNVSIAERRVFSANDAYYFDATYERRKEARVLPEIEANLARKAIETMKRVN
jgi:hypothetical protein